MDFLAILDVSSDKPADYIKVALAIETLAYHNKNLLWTGDEAKISEEMRYLLTEALAKL